MNTIKHAIAKFSHDEDGAQVVEYALIIAVVSIALVVALSTLAGTPVFNALSQRISDCLSGTCS